MNDKILIVEDEELTREGLVEYFKEKGYDTFFAADGQKALELFQEQTFDLILLDVMLPQKNGFYVLKEIRKSSATPVLMLTAMTDEQTQILSFDAKADDYVAKPFSLVVLEKRVAALIRRSQKTNNPAQEMFTFKDAVVDFTGYTATFEGKKVDIKPKEIQVLKLLLRHSGQVLTREQILNGIYGNNEAPLDRVVDVYIKNLRKKLHLTCIHTIKGVGYKYLEEK